MCLLVDAMSASLPRIQSATAARILGVSQRSVQGLALRGELPGAARIGGVWTFDAERLATFVKQRELRRRAAFDFRPASVPAAASDSSADERRVSAAHGGAIQPQRRSLTRAIGFVRRQMREIDLGRVDARMPQVLRHAIDARTAAQRLDGVHVAEIMKPERNTRRQHVAPSWRRPAGQKPTGRPPMERSIRRSGRGRRYDRAPLATAL